MSPYIINKAAVIAASVDWAAAFDRLDPTMTVQKFIKLGVRPALIPIIISYMSNRRMIVKFKGAKSKPTPLIGGGPQGTLLGGIQYNVSNDCSREDIRNEDRYKYFDYLNILELLALTELFSQYNFKNHVASDIGINQPYLPPEKFNMQKKLNSISEWSQKNLMMLNESKCSYIVFTRSKSEFSTRLSLNEVTLERKSVVRILGLWIQDNMKWDYNTKQICIKAYSRMHILNKLKYAGIKESDLLTIFKLFLTVYLNIAV